MNPNNLLSVVFMLLATLNFGCQANNMSEADKNKTHERATLNETDLLKLGSNGPPQIKVDTQARTVTLTTVSTGCTRPEHFTISVDSAGNYVGKRIKADRCRRRAFVVTYDYPLDSLPQS